MRLAGIYQESTVDGPGINMVIYTQGCPHRCSNCHNPSTHDEKGGVEMSVEEVKKKIKETKEATLITGITFSGGEPLSQLKDIVELAAFARELNLNTTLYTGYSLFFKEEGVMAQGNKRLSLREDSFKDIDIIFDGPFKSSLRDTLSTPFRGSTNQRMLFKQNGKWQKV